MKVPHRLKLFVDAGESDIGNGIDGKQLLKHLLSDVLGRSLVFELLKQITLNSFYACAQNVYTYTPLAAGDKHGVEALIATELFPGAIALFDKKSRPFRFFERRESSVATDALAPPADRLPFSGWPRIEDSLIFFSAEWALH